MASSAAAAPPSPPKPSNSHVDDGDEEIEYEEIEVEEEVEVEEEDDVADEEENGVQEDDDIGIGEDLTPVRKENDANGEGTSRDNDRKAPFDNSGKVNEGTSKAKDNTIVSIVAETNHTAVEEVKGKKQMSPRLHVPQIRSRESSFNAEFGGESKKMMIACEFHAKGWCIKGNSCRFLHMNHGLTAERKCESSGREASSGAYSSMHGSPSNTRKTVFETTLTEMINRKNNIIPNDLRSGDLSYSHSKHPLSFGLGTQNPLESGQTQEHHASLSSSSKRNTSPFSHLKSPPVIHEYKQMYASWDMTVIYRPSHPLTQNFMKENLYDQIYDGVEQGSSPKNVHLRSNNAHEEGKLLNSVYVRDTMNAKILSSSDDSKLKSEKPQPQMEVKAGEKSEANVDLKRDGQLQIEPRALKYFQAELIEYIKELVKPTWREGLMSKDAHKLIVKKSVDKVISSFQRHQIPSTAESIKLYLSSSESKIANLVEAYIGKYGKY